MTNKMSIDNWPNNNLSNDNWPNNMTNDHWPKSIGQKSTIRHKS